jgi:hypothetical protein
MGLDDFAAALMAALAKGDFTPVREVRVVLRQEDQADTLRAALVGAVERRKPGSP